MKGSRHSITSTLTLLHPLMPGSHKVVKYCFTLNNYTNEEQEQLRLLALSCRYLIFGRETGENNTPHLQGFIHFGKPHSFTQAKEALGNRCHIERTKGTAYQAAEYCKKEQDFEEFGEKPAKAKTSMYKEAHQLIQEHGFKQGVELLGWKWHAVGANVMRTIRLKPHHRPDVEAYWFVGPTGTGKSRLAHQLLPHAYIKDARTKWWHGYEYEYTTIIDDMGPKGISLNHLLKWLDRYKCNVETKGGQMALHCQQFIITSNFMPTDCFPEDDYKNIQALERRLTIKHIL